MPAGDLGKVYADGEVIFEEGETGECMYVVIQGKVEIYQTRNDQEVILGVCREGDFLGEMAVMTREKRSASARALGPARMITIDKRNFLRRVQEDPTIAMRLVQGLSKRIRELNQEVNSLNHLINQYLDQNINLHT